MDSRFDFVSRNSFPKIITVRKPSATNAIHAQDLALTSGCVGESFGIFRVSHPLNVIQRRIMQQMQHFYNDGELQILCSLIDQSGPVSLRTLDWLVTSFSKCKEIFATDDREYNIHDHYKLYLSKYKRRNFDPFRRSRRRVNGKHVNYDIEFAFAGNTFMTTVGQLNFVAWCIKHGTYSIAVQNKTQIEKAMGAANKRKRQSKPAVSQASVTAYQVQQKIQL